MSGEKQKVKRHTVADHSALVDSATFAGVCEAEGWRTDTVMSQSKFTEAVKRFETAPACGNYKEKN